MARPHTSRAFQEELEALSARLVGMGQRCTELIEMASRAMSERDVELAARVEAADREIDTHEMEIDELAVRILALRQPAARDLRFLVFALKVVTDLERIGDEAANLAERGAQLAAQGVPRTDLQPALQEMAALTRVQVERALEAFVAGDEALAREVSARDMAGLVGDYALELVRVLSFDDDPGMQEDVLPAGNEGVQAGIGNDVDIDIGRFEAGSLDEGIGIIAQQMLDFRIPDQ